MEPDIRAVLARLALIARALHAALQSEDSEVWDKAIETAVKALSKVVTDVDWERIADVPQLDWDPQETLVKMVDTVAEQVKTADVTTPGRRAAVVNRVLGVQKRVENMVEDVKHTGEMMKVEAAAEEKDKHLVWMPERGACPICLDLGGAMAAPGAEFHGMGLLGEPSVALRPPAHPNCRCRVKAISKEDGGGFAAAVKREAARSAALGMSEYASKEKLAELAGHVSKVGVPLPKTVLAKAAKLSKHPKVLSRKRASDEGS